MREQQWRQTQLSELFEVQRESVIPAASPDTDFYHHSLPAWDELGGPVVEKGASIESNKTLITGPSVLFSKLNPRKPRVSVIEDLPPGTMHCASTEFVCLQPKGEQSLRFWGYYFAASEFSRRLDRHAIGSTNSHTRVNPRQPLAWSVSVPPIDEQELIAQILDTQDTQIRRTEALIAKLEQIKQGLLTDLLTRGIDENSQLRPPPDQAPHLYKDSPLGRIPRTWNVVPLGTAALKIQDGTHFSPELGGHDFLYLTSRNIRFGFIDLADSEMISAVEHRKIFRRCDVSKGDLLLTKDGANTGNAAINTLNEEISLLSSVAFIRFNPETDLASFHLHYLLSSYGQQRMKDLMSGNAITRLTLEKIRAFCVPRPPMAEQARIAELLDAHDHRSRAESQAAGHLQQLKSGLMDDLLTGRVRVTPLLNTAEQAAG